MHVRLMFVQNLGIFAQVYIVSPLLSLWEVGEPVIRLKQASKIFLIVSKPPKESLFMDKNGFENFF